MSKSQTNVSYSSSKRPRASAVVHVQATPARSMRMSYGGPGGFGSSMKTSVVSRGHIAAGPPGELATLSKQSLNSVKDSRSKEKQDLQGLNVQLATMLERYAFIEGQNKQLSMELEKWKKMKEFNADCFKDIQINEIEELRKGKLDAEGQSARFEAELIDWKDKYDTAMEDLKVMREQRDKAIDGIENIHRELTTREHDIKVVSQEKEFVDNRLKMLQEELENIKGDIDRERNDLMAARAEQMCAVQEGLEDLNERDLIIDCKDAQIEELTRKIEELQRVEPGYDKMWESQFRKTVQKLQEDCDDRMNRQLADMELKYQTKIDRLQASMPREKPDSGITRAETKTLKSELGTKNNELRNLRDENASLRAQLEALQDQLKEQFEKCEIEKDELRDRLERECDEKNGIKDDLMELTSRTAYLENEISTYRHLLDKGMGDLSAEKGNYQSYGGSQTAQMIMGGGGGGSGGGRGSGFGSGSGSSGGGGMSSSQQSNKPKREPVKKEPSPGDKAPKKKPENGSTESVGRTRIQKTCTGSSKLSIDEIAMDGSYVKILNKNEQDMVMDSFTLSRSFPGNRDKRTSTFTFPSGFVIKSRGSARVFCFRFRDEASKDELKADKDTCYTWGLMNEPGTCELKKGSTTVSTYTVSVS